MEKRRSEGTDDPGIAKYFLASIIKACAMRLFITKTRWRLHYYVILWVWFYGPIPVFGIDPRYRTSGIDDMSTFGIVLPTTS